MSSILGICGIGFSLYYVFNFPSPGFRGYFDTASLVLLLIAPPSIMLLSHSLSDFFLGIETLFRALFIRPIKSKREVINILTESSALVRSQGMGALVSVRDKAQYELLRDGLSLIVNNFTPDEIRHNLQAKINNKQSKLELASNLFENMAKVSPGVGMIGTLLGLIDMMVNLTDPSKIGAGMALAMITTLYGLLLGTFIYGPCSEKISLESEKILETDLMVMEGILGLKGKKSSVHFKDILKTYGQSPDGRQASARAAAGAQQRRRG